MAAVIVDTGLSALLDILNSDIAATCVLGLFQSNTTPTQATVWADLTEATFHGYATQALATWAAAGVAAHVASSLGAAYLFAFTAGAPTNNIYGYYVRDTASGLLVIAERFAAPPKPMAVVGDTITITPTDTLQAA